MLTTIRKLFTTVYKDPSGSYGYMRYTHDLPDIDDDLEASFLIPLLTPIVCAKNSRLVTREAWKAVVAKHRESAPLALVEANAEVVQSPLAEDAAPMAVADQALAAPPAPIEALEWERVLAAFGKERPLLGSLFGRASFAGSTPTQITLGFLPGGLELHAAQDAEKKAALEGFLSAWFGRPIDIKIIERAYEDTLYDKGLPRANLAREAQGLAPLQKTEELDAPRSRLAERATEIDDIFSELFEGHEIRWSKDATQRIAILDVIAAMGYAQPKAAWRDIQGRLPELVSLKLTNSKNSSGVEYMVLGRGAPTPVCDLETLLKILSACDAPDKNKLERFRGWSAKTLARYVKGDETLGDEVKVRALIHSGTQTEELAAAIRKLEEGRIANDRRLEKIEGAVARIDAEKDAIIAETVGSQERLRDEVRAEVAEQIKSAGVAVARKFEELRRELAAARSTAAQSEPIRPKVVLTPTPSPRASSGKIQWVDSPPMFWRDSIALVRRWLWHSNNDSHEQFLAARQTIKDLALRCEHGSQRVRVRHHRGHNRHSDFFSGALYDEVSALIETAEHREEQRS